jgi:F0F1-type ATP synthase delta subunit
LNKSQKEEVTKIICEIFQVDNVEIYEKLDKSILGGYIIKVGDTIIDCSTKNKLNGLQDHLLRSNAL